MQCIKLQPELLGWEPMPFICSMAPINQAHTKAIPDAAIARPLLTKEAFYGSTRTVLVCRQCYSIPRNPNGPADAACPFWSRGGYLGTVYALHVPVKYWYPSASVARKLRRNDFPDPPFIFLFRKVRSGAKHHKHISRSCPATELGVS